MCVCVCERERDWRGDRWRCDNCLYSCIHVHVGSAVRGGVGDKGGRLMFGILFWLGIVSIN